MIKILICEDIERDRLHLHKLLNSFLQSNNILYEIDYLENFDVGSNLFLEYDLIFLDHMMPELDGVETFSYMQSMQENLCKDTPVIVLTANAIIGAKEQYLKIGFCDYLSKPIDPQLLENLIVEQLLLQNINVETIPIPENNAGLYEDKKQEEKQELPQIEGFDWAYGLLHFPDVMGVCRRLL